MTRYRTFAADNARWDGFAFRPGDIVISTPPKSGTTWTQMLCALLIFDGPDLPAPLDQLSPWLDHQIRGLDAVLAGLEAQEHRRFVKTHTPLDGLPRRGDVTYVVVGRDPRDVAVSMEHHFANMDFERVAELRAAAVGVEDLADLPERVRPPSDPRERFMVFVERDSLGGPATLASVLHHLHTAWDRRRAPNIGLFHFADYQADLPAELTRLGELLGIRLTEGRARELAVHAGLDRMRARAAEVVPGASDRLWKDQGAFLRAGASGQWRSRVTEADLERYDERVASLVPPDLAAWAHLGRLSSGIDPHAPPADA